MANNQDIIISHTKQQLVERVAKDFLDELAQVLKTKPGEDIHVSLTGGSVGIGILKHVNTLLQRSRVIDWYHVHFWWSDERWLPLHDVERNDYQAEVALLDGLGLPPENLHNFATSDAGLSLEEAAAQMQTEYAEAGSPEFEISLLGVGPDAHVASLFPNQDGIKVEEATIIAVEDSPKPPSERLSFTAALINRSVRVWIAFAGLDKAEAYQHLILQSDRNIAPVAAIAGSSETRVYVDKNAAEGK